MIGAIPKGLFGRGMTNAMGTGMGQAMITAPMQEPERPKSFWQGGNKFTGRDALAGALAVIGDGLSNWGGGSAGATQALMASRMQPELERQRMAQAQMQRAQELADYRIKKGIDAEFREPPAPTEFERALAGAGIDPNSEQGRMLYRQYAERKAMGPDPLLQGAPLPGGGTYTGPFSGYKGMAGTRPVAQSDWDNAKPMGGTAGNGGGTFQR